MLRKLCGAATAWWQFTRTCHAVDRDYRSYNHDFADRTVPVVPVSIHNFWSDNRPNWFCYFLRAQLGLNIRLVRGDAYMAFFSLFGPRQKVLDSKARVKVFYAGENVHRGRYREYEDHCLGNVDLALGFDRIHAPNYLRLPIWMLELFKRADFAHGRITHNAITKRIHAINALPTHPRKRFCALIAGHDSHPRREMHDVLCRIQPVSCPGSLFHNDPLLKQQYSNDKLLYLRDFRFTICPENSSYPGYITEKLLHAFLAGCIPIYWGDVQLEPGVFNPDAVLTWHTGQDNQDLIEQIRYINSSDTRFFEFRTKHPPLLESAVDIISDGLERLESAIRRLI